MVEKILQFDLLGLIKLEVEMNKKKLFKFTCAWKFIAKGRKKIF
jgi:hypothetical protein